MVLPYALAVHHALCRPFFHSVPHSLPRTTNHTRLGDRKICPQSSEEWKDTRLVPPFTPAHRTSSSFSFPLFLLLLLPDGWRDLDSLEQLHLLLVDFLESLENTFQGGDVGGVNSGHVGNGLRQVIGDLLQLRPRVTQLLDLGWKAHVSVSIAWRM